jgi:myo-inositol-1-phosphate synthase
MRRSEISEIHPPLLIVAGAKGAVASTLAVSLAVLQRDPEAVLSSLTTAEKFPYLGPCQNTRMCGWDRTKDSLRDSLKVNSVLPEDLWRPHADFLDQITVLEAPSPRMDLKTQVEKIVQDIKMLCDQHSNMRPVFIDLLPATELVKLENCEKLTDLYAQVDPTRFPDLLYAMAALRCAIPIINFTPNALEIPALVQEAVAMGVPIAGRDGKTGQTYMKVVLASALKARNLLVDGWYSLNILGNADGRNLLQPEKAAGKLVHKTEILDKVLGYRVGEKYGTSSHKVHIDYYPPRGDAKEAWDVIDFEGLFRLPMSIRMNLQGRDSILAAPLVLDLARWMVALQLAGRSGPIPELAFYFKEPVGPHPPLSFQDQVLSLQRLEEELSAKNRSTPVQNAV